MANEASCYDSAHIEEELGRQNGATLHNPGSDLSRRSGYVAECLNLAVVTQGQTLDETVQNLREALQLHLESEDLAEMGLASHPPLLITMEMEPVHA